MKCWKKWLSCSTGCSLKCEKYCNERTSDQEQFYFKVVFMLLNEKKTDISAIPFLVVPRERKAP